MLILINKMMTLVMSLSFMNEVVVVARCSQPEEKRDTPHP